jgi:hypothetical protein
MTKKEDIRSGTILASRSCTFRFETPNNSFSLSFSIINDLILGSTSAVPVVDAMEKDVDESENVESCFSRWHMVCSFCASSEFYNKDNPLE